MTVTVIAKDCAKSSTSIEREPRKESVCSPGKCSTFCSPQNLPESLRSCPATMQYHSLHSAMTKMTKQSWDWYSPAPSQCCDINYWSPSHGTLAGSALRRFGYNTDVWVCVGCYNQHICICCSTMEKHTCFLFMKRRSVGSSARKIFRTRPADWRRFACIGLQRKVNDCSANDLNHSCLEATEDDPNLPCHTS